MIISRIISIIISKIISNTTLKIISKLNPNMTSPNNSNMILKVQNHKNPRDNFRKHRKTNKHVAFVYWPYWNPIGTLMEP